MARQRRRGIFNWVVAIVAGIPTAMIVALSLYFFHPILLAGPSVWRLSADDRVAYLILADQLASGKPLSNTTHQNRPVPVVVGTSEKLCHGASRDLIAALKSSGADQGFELVPLTCDAGPSPYLFVADEGDGYSGGLVCGSLCGWGNHYRVWRFLGLSMVRRDGRFVM